MNSTVCKYPSQRYLELAQDSHRLMNVSRNTPSEWNGMPRPPAMLLKESQTAIQNSRKGFPGIIAAAVLVTSEYIALYFRGVS